MPAAIIYYTYTPAGKRYSWYIYFTRHRLNHPETLRKQRNPFFCFMCTAIQGYSK
jgi:hypothetical protein